LRDCLWQDSGPWGAQKALQGVYCHESTCKFIICLTLYRMRISSQGFLSNITRWTGRRRSRKLLTSTRSVRLQLVSNSRLQRGLERFLISRSLLSITDSWAQAQTWLAH
jgi:hypothetical protein